MQMWRNHFNQIGTINKGQLIKCNDKVYETVLRKKKDQ